MGLDQRVKELGPAKELPPDVTIPVCRPVEPVEALKPAAPVVAEATVSALLAEARAIHTRYRSESKRMDYPVLEGYIREAQRLRQEAHDADPEHADPAWLDDAKNNQGVVMRHRGKDTATLAREAHEALMGFYATYLITP